MTIVHIYDTDEDIYSYKNAANANELAEALHETRDYLRGLWKHADLEGKTADDLIDEIYEHFHDIAGYVLRATE